MTSSHAAPPRWPNPNVAASARENGPRDVMVNDPDTVPPGDRLRASSLAPGSDSGTGLLAGPGQWQAVRKPAHPGGQKWSGSGNAKRRIGAGEPVGDLGWLRAAGRQHAA